MDVIYIILLYLLIGLYVLIGYCSEHRTNFIKRICIILFWPIIFGLVIFSFDYFKFLIKVILSGKVE